MFLYICETETGGERHDEGKCHFLDIQQVNRTCSSGHFGEGVKGRIHYSNMNTTNNFSCHNRVNVSKILLSDFKIVRYVFGTFSPKIISGHQ